jgi:hypothetical protein
VSVARWIALIGSPTYGGASFLACPVRVNKPGQWAGNPADLIPTTVIRIPNTVALACSQKTGTLANVDTNHVGG